MIGKYVLVRTYSAGVHCGYLVMHSGTVVQLKHTSILWDWRGANTCHEVALRGCGEDSRISEPVEEKILTEAIEILVCTEEARINLSRSRWRKS